MLEDLPGATNDVKTVNTKRNIRAQWKNDTSNAKGCRADSGDRLGDGLTALDGASGAAARRPAVISCGKSRKGSDNESNFELHNEWLSI